MLALYWALCMSACSAASVVPGSVTPWTVALQAPLPMDCSPLGSSVYEISQARLLEQAAISFSVLHAKVFSNLEATDQSTEMAVS